ncbi:DsrE family protein [Shewanella sp. 202IG2-18]|uniref:DsrE family protein n=1 Tax=Parashewanella hymeniacidonis TaxID=2807618 RepID=UPI0019602209|nr:DsrE family protein [Parashewanella hymeniacidonis]MBM7074125.1 DsrE family protein [Parashewanella hymeniacidonis]
MFKRLGIGLFSILCAFQSFAGIEAFHQGPVFKSFGKIADVNTSVSIPKNMKFHVAFDMSKASDVGKINRNLDTLGRFINMHVANGVPKQDIKVAMVVHGKSVTDLANHSFYSKLHSGSANANQNIVKQLIAFGVKIYICGQSAAYYGLSQKDLLPNVDMALSAMTAHAILHSEGYSLNPF